MLHIFTYGIVTIYYTRSKKIYSDGLIRQMDNNISFGANFIRKIPIKQFSYESKLYTKTTANFVELNPFDTNDLNTLKKTIWEFGDDTYASNIYNDAFYLNNKSENIEFLNFFALTKQKTGFENLHPDEILGISEITEKGGKTINLNYLQIDPHYLYSYPYPPFFKRIGSAILDCLKLVHNKITLCATPTAIEFYKKNGFKSLEHNKRLMVWERKV